MEQAWKLELKYKEKILLDQQDFKYCSYCFVPKLIDSGPVNDNPTQPSYYLVCIWTLRETS